MFLNNRLLYAVLGVVFIFCLGFPYPYFIPVGQILLLSIGVLVLIDALLLFSAKRPIAAKRIIENKLSNGDYNPVILQLKGKLAFSSRLEVIDEFPVQLQLRDKAFELDKTPRIFEKEVLYEIRPVQRGVYQFGHLHIFISTPLQLLKRRLSIDLSQEVKVYPSFIQYRKYSFLAISNRLSEEGVKKVRHIGQSKEFEQIKDYVLGDDYRKINWRATARRNELMVNQHQEEKSQNVYCLVDKGRMMQMPFNGMNLIDYAINSTLVLLGIAQARGDKAGMITFSDKIGSFIPAKGIRTQMGLISEALYNQQVRMKEPDYLRLYKNIRVQIKKRSLLILFTNFDSMISLQNQLHYLKAIAKNHVLCTVIFDNSEVNERANSKTSGLKSLYDQTMAEKLQHDKKLIVKELNKNGIYSILTEPQDLTINTINKYLELKARGVL